MKLHQLKSTPVQFSSSDFYSTTSPEDQNQAKTGPPKGFFPSEYKKLDKNVYLQ